jgi:fructosamine-3-kinase
LCFEFINGNHFDGSEIDAKDATEQIAQIVSNYREYPHGGYGFLNEEHVSWRAFLLDEIEYARRTIPDVPTEKVMSALEVAGAVNPKQYLLHGDFGTHNFLLENGKIRVIDPMPVVGDYLYDFYFALLSNVGIFTHLGADYVYGFFPERELSYKRAVLTVALYVRMSRAATYDKENLPSYFDLYSAIIEQ